jgi:hypothetical protein
LVFDNKYFDIYCEKCGDKYEFKYKNTDSSFLNDNEYKNTDSYNKYELSIDNKYESTANIYNNNMVENIDDKWCQRCQIDYLENNFEICKASGNEKIDSLIQEMQLKINNTVFEWIPYKQFNNIKEIGKGGSSTVYSAIWENGLLYYGYKYTPGDFNYYSTYQFSLRSPPMDNNSTQVIRHYDKWKRKPNTRVALKCLNHSQIFFVDKFINEVWNLYITSNK